MDSGSLYLESVASEFRKLKRLAERALAQVQDDRSLHLTLDSESNSLAILLQHVGGNLLSRFSDFLASDGEKPTRNRDQEFVAHPEHSREALLKIWEGGWGHLFSTLEALSEKDLQATVRIRGEAHTVIQALERSLSHTASHVGQIVFLAKHWEAARWTSLTIPRGRSAEAGAYRPKS
jgi:hypothetical protein